MKCAVPTVVGDTGGVTGSIREAANPVSCYTAMRRLMPEFAVGDKMEAEEVRYSFFFLGISRIFSFFKS